VKCNGKQSFDGRHLKDTSYYVWLGIIRDRLDNFNHSTQKEILSGKNGSRYQLKK